MFYFESSKLITFCESVSLQVKTFYDLLKAFQGPLAESVFLDITQSVCTTYFNLKK